ncbi:MAG: pyruvate/2-oxoglutarate dehydrogenase complex dihydrolipoamide dehydrogenase (E3) component [Candidatus Poriferisodalaceae bacterium]|jgi:pyruvate/2-oxoglutarate dehydrogenase complex dihydrolipoamide dehydrogenase (E3) component|tara:strand:+ start:1278 stop:2645 length:1368 start_codon:yes stop_codon:yes gene_type:complete
MIKKKVVVVGGGPAGHNAAALAARYGAQVVLVERDVIGGLAHLRDCVPSKSMIATGGALSFARRLDGMGLAQVETEINVQQLRNRIQSIEDRLERSVTELLTSLEVQIIRGTAHLSGPNSVSVKTEVDEIEIEADVIVLATGSRPRIPEWAVIDSERILTTRDAYPPKEIPEHLVVVGSGVTGVEFVHMFSSLGSEVTLIVSRQQVLPNKDPEAAALLEQTFLDRGVQLFKGARATGIKRTGQKVEVYCSDGRLAKGSHALIAIGSQPNTESLGLDNANVLLNSDGHVEVDHNLKSSVPSIYVAGDLSGKLPLSSVAAMQGRKIAEHIMGLHDGRPHRHLAYDKAASAIFTDPEIADVGLVEAEAFATGRKIRVTKVPFSSNAKALINDDPKGFVKIVSDPNTGHVLGGSIVGRHAAELISVVALAVTANLTVQDVHESLFVYPSLSEALSEAAE